MLQHHRPALERLRSVLSIHLPFLRSTKAADATGSMNFRQLKDPRLHTMADTIQGPYSHLEADVPSPPHATMHRGYELGQLQNP